MISERDEQELMSFLLNSAKTRAEKQKLGKVILYTFNEDMLRQMAFDIFSQIDIE